MDKKAYVVYKVTDAGNTEPLEACNTETEAQELIARLEGYKLWHPAVKRKPSIFGYRHGYLEVSVQ